MSVTSGFYNSVNKDRRYNAEQMSDIFDGVVNDGVFANIGSAFSVTADTGFQINVGIGRAWFNRKWVFNDAILPLTLDEPEVLLNRIDAVVIEIDTSEEVRDGTIKIVKGTPSSSPQNPDLSDTEFKHQHPLSYIFVEAGASSITQSKITNTVGTSECPYVTGILEVVSIDNLIAQWGAQWVEWFSAEKNLSESEREEIKKQWNTWFNSISGDWDSWFANTTEESEVQFNSWMAQMKSDFISWFQGLEDILEPDVAANLANRILKVEKSMSTLENTNSIFSFLLDSAGDTILDSFNLEILGTRVLINEKSITASNTQYSNASSKLNADTVQGAIDELSNQEPVIVYHAIAKASDWIGAENVLKIPGLLKDDPVIIGTDDFATDEEWEAATNAMYRGVFQGFETIRIRAYGSVPMIDFPILVYFWPKGR